MRISDGYQPAPGADAVDVLRQMEKARIRERIMREETMDRFELELEVRLELVDRFRQRSVVLNAAGAEPTTARVTAANSSSLPAVAPEVSCPERFFFFANVFFLRIFFFGNVCVCFSFVFIVSLYSLHVFDVASNRLYN